MHQSQCVMNPCIFRAWGRILYASNVIFPISVWAFKSYFIHDTSCILPTSCRLPGAHVCTAAVLIKSWGQHRLACSTRQVHTHTHTPTQILSADATLRAFIWSLQDVRKLKRFIGWCSNYHRPTVAFFLHWLVSREMDPKRAGLSTCSPACGKLCPGEVF